MKRKIRTFEIANLRPHPRQAEWFADMSDVELRELADDIKRNGLQHPVEVLPDGRIVCGHQRVLALQLLGKETISCWVRQHLADAGEAAIEERLISDNLNRRQLSPLGAARCYKRLKELRGRGGRRSGEGDWRDVIGQRYGISGRTLDRWARLLDLPVEIQQAVEAGKLSLQQGTAIRGQPKKFWGEVVVTLQQGKDIRQLLARRTSSRKAATPIPTYRDHMQPLKTWVSGSQAGLPKATKAERTADLPLLRKARRILRQMIADIDDGQPAAPVRRTK